jgi:hypothetical protein
MFKKLGIIGFSIVLLGVGTVWAQERGSMSSSSSQSGPTRVDVQTEVRSEPGQPPIRSQRILINGQPVEPNEAMGNVFFSALPEGVKPGDYWLGLGIAVPSPEMRRELKLPEGQGLVVQSVIPDGPAAKADIKLKDVLLKAGDKPLKQVQDLLDVANEAKDKPIAIDIQRINGNQEKVTVTPAKRPAPPSAAQADKLRADSQRIMEQARRNQAEAQRLELEARRLELLSQLSGMPNAGGAPFQVQILGPGQILPPDVLMPMRVPLPDDMTIMINKTGGKPAEVMVQWGKEKWEVTEEQLDKLPERVRRFVDQMLGRVAISIIGGQAGGVRVIAPGEPATPPVRPLAKQPPLNPTPGAAAAPAETRLERRIEDLNARLDRLTRLVEEMNSAQPRAKKAPIERPQEKGIPGKPAAEKATEM